MVVREVVSGRGKFGNAPARDTNDHTTGQDETFLPLLAVSIVLWIPNQLADFYSKVRYF